jgi:trans-2-enoyl-CoA reductase
MYLNVQKYDRSMLRILTFIFGLTTLTLAGTSAAQQESRPEVKYIEFSQLGDPAEVLEVKLEESRALEGGEVRVKVLVTPIHPSILLQISGNYGTTPTLPSVPGNEGVGRVVETSPEVTGLSVGQLVLLVSGSTWRDEIVAPVTSFIGLPDMIGFPKVEYDQTNIDRHRHVFRKHAHASR